MQLWQNQQQAQCTRCEKAGHPRFAQPFREEYLRGKTNIYALDLSWRDAIEE
jgi:hypothetical protein